MSKKRTIGVSAAVVFLVLLLGSLLFPALRTPERERRVFWFPDVTRESVHEEFRFVPYRETPREKVTLFVRELMLGPARMDSVPFIPRNVSLSSVILDDMGRLFIDFSPELVIREEELQFSLEDIQDLLEKNVGHSFPFVQEVVITVSGQVPNLPRFTNPPLTKNEGAL